MFINFSSDLDQDNNIITKGNDNNNKINNNSNINNNINADLINIKFLL